MAPKNKKTEKKKDKDGGKGKLPSKVLCKLVKDDFLRNYPGLFRELVGEGRYMCRKCGRVALRKKSLCKGEKL